MKIIWGTEQAVIANHAKQTILGIERYERINGHKANPRGVAVHSAVFPISCDKCGMTFWARDPYARHIKCGKEGKNLGFQYE